MKIIEWFLNLFLSKRAKQVKHSAYIELKKANEDYLNAKKVSQKYLSKYSGRRRYTKV